MLSKGGLSVEEFEEEYSKQKAILENSGEWKRHSLEEVLGARIDEQNQDGPGLIR